MAKTHDPSRSRRSEDAALQSVNFRGRHSAVTKNAKLGKQGYFAVLAGSKFTLDAVNKGPLVFTE